MFMVMLITYYICIYILIGCVFSLIWLWRCDVIGDSLENFKPLVYVLRCTFLWPYLIFKKDER